VTKPILLTLDVARFGLPFLSLLMAIQGFISLFGNEARAVGLALLRWYVIICGLSRMFVFHQA